MIPPSSINAAPAGNVNVTFEVQSISPPVEIVKFKVFKPEVASIFSVSVEPVPSPTVTELILSVKVEVRVIVSPPSIETSFVVGAPV